MKRIVSLFMAILVLFLTGCGEDGILLSQDTESVQVHNEAASEINEEAALSDELMYVYICGEVVEPGVYPLPPGSRIYELVEAAGGLTESAAPESVNLAQELTDGQMINIPAEGEIQDASTVGTESGTDGDKININTASKELLMSLNGIGETKAESILSYREQNGPFDSLEDLMQVDGIGQGTFSKIKDKITI
ncbi:MAG: hypothetical protein E7236_08045 [Lachnospiraceae bacterium]|nr:hypothetical protein [Lachnospiraceae bacterium]